MKVETCIELPIVLYKEARFVEREEAREAGGMAGRWINRQRLTERLIVDKVSHTAEGERSGTGWTN